MSLSDCQGSAYAFRELMRRADAEIKAGAGELKPARVLYRTAHPKRVSIGRFAAKLLRMRAKN